MRSRLGSGDLTTEFVLAISGPVTDGHQDPCIRSKEATGLGRSLSFCPDAMHRSSGGGQLSTLRDFA